MLRGCWRIRNYRTYIFKIMDIKIAFKEFSERYNETEINQIWKQQSEQFKEFWNDRIMQGDQSLEDSEIDDIVRLLDKKAKGSRPTDEAVATVMVPQGAWRRMFNQFKEQPALRNALNSVIIATSNDNRIKAIDELYVANQGNKNNLTGKSASAVNAFLAVSDPFKNLSIASLNDRFKIIKYLGIHIPGFEEMSEGEKSVWSNERILDYFKENNISSNARSISYFCYTSSMTENWKTSADSEPKEPEGSISENEERTYKDEQFKFYMESHLEDFLIENWDKTELGKKYELYEEEGELVSQQYRTDIGKIDILAKEKGTGAFVVIELKKGQTSDDTVGQISRYMGWIDEHKSIKNDTKGIIITGQYDKRLYYALKRIRDVEIFIYKVNFQLTEYKESY